MSRPTLARTMIPIAACLATLTLPAVPAAAQQGSVPEMSRMQFGVGWVGNAPEAMLGGAAYVLLPRSGGIGLYLDAKFDVSNPSGERGYDASVTSRQIAAQEVGATFVRTEESWSSVNVAVMRPLTPYLIAYAGGGLARATRYDLWNVDIASPFGEGGVAWAEDPDQEETSANLMVGVLMRLTRRASAHFGYETKPSGVTVGVSLRLPPW